MFAHKKNQMKTPKYVHFGSTLLYVENQEHQDDDNVAALPRANIIEIVQVNVKSNERILNLTNV